MSNSNRSEPQWPPRSPHEALLSTPGGRDRLRRLQERGSPSPSPIKRSKSTPALNKTIDMNAGLGLDGAGDYEDDEDEEMLQLQLQEIQARLKLKRLQKRTQESDTQETNRVASVLSRASAAPSRAQSRMSKAPEERLQRSRSQATIEVPASPIRKVKQVELPRSPSRVLLGIDKGLKGSQVSLKTAPSLRKPREVDIQETRRSGPYLQRPNSQAATHSHAPTSIGQEEAPKTFSERMAAIRAQHTEREERQERIRNNRSTAFEVDHQKMQSFKDNAVDLSNAPRLAPAFSRDEILGSQGRKNGLPRSSTAPSIRSVDAEAPSWETDSTDASRHAKSKQSTQEMSDSDASQFEPFSSLHLSKRVIPHNELTRMLKGKKTFLIPDLLKTVKAPDFDGPDVEEDVVVFAIIAGKSEPRQHQPVEGKNEKRKKYMVMSLTDLKWELDLFLFDAAYEKFWTLTTGTLLAILNPSFMPPPRGRADTGKFSLTLNSDADTVLDVGTARDLGYCKSIKKDGKKCGSWVDRRHTEFCDYHVNEALKRTRAGRMEVNSMNFGFGSGGKSSKWDGKFTKGDKEWKKKDNPNWIPPSEFIPHGPERGKIFIGGRTTASLLDDPDIDPDAFTRGSTKAERITRHLVSKERERELARKLANMGSGLGADYMSSQSQSSANPNRESQESRMDLDDEAPQDATSLGILKRTAKDIHLSPVKRKRDRAGTLSGSHPIGGESSTAGALPAPPPTREAKGWGGDLKKELSRMKNGENLSLAQYGTRAGGSSTHTTERTIAGTSTNSITRAGGDIRPPAKKKTRFVTDRGIKIAGRESFGGDAAATHDDNDLDDDDDDLDIVA